jgi:hypothetical protein
MSIKDHALLVSLRVNKPQMTQKDDKATYDAEAANNAHGAGQFRKDLYPKALVQPILAVESATRAYIESTAYMWTRGEYLLPTSRFMDFTEQIARFEVQFNQSVTAFLNNWGNVMQRAAQAQGDLFDASVYPDLSELKNDFRFRVVYRPVTDVLDFRVRMQEEELDLLRRQVEQATRESMDSILKEPLQRLKSVVSKLNDVANKPDRQTVDKKTGATVMKPPIFRDSVCENIIEEINLLHDFAEIMPDHVLSAAKDIADVLPKPETLRSDPDKRKEIGVQTEALLAAIDNMLED